MGAFTKAPLSAVLTDANGYTLSASNPIPVNPAESGAPNFATGQTSVANTATQIVASRSTRRAVVITNPASSTTVYLGASNVTTSTGHALPAGNSISIPSTLAIYGIVSTGTQTVTSFDVYD